MCTGEMQATTYFRPRKGYLARESMEDAPGEVEHVEGPRDLGVHVFDANETADGDDGPVTAESIA